VIVNHYSGIEKAIPAIPSLPGFKTSAGMFDFVFFVLVVCSATLPGPTANNNPYSTSQHPNLNSTKHSINTEIMSNNHTQHSSPP
jgi:hypothetical protein